jgi:hypothetical protein
MRGLAIFVVVGLAGCTVSDRRYVLPPDASVDAESDGPDVFDGASVQNMFDVGYANQWRVNGTLHDAGQNANFVTWARFVNEGSEPLDMSTATIVGVVDDHPTFFDAVVTWESTIDLSPGFSAGALSQASSQLIVNSGLVTEPAQDTSLPTLRMVVDNFASSGAWLFVNFEITVEIGNARATLPITLSNSGTNPLAPDSAARVTSAPI